MKEFVLLTRLFASMGTGWSSKGSTKDKLKTNKVAISFLIFVALPIAFALGLLSYYMTFILRPLGGEILVLELGISVSCLFMFFFGLIMIPSTFYFSDDVQSLMSMPVQPHNVFMAKLINTYFWENMTSFFVFVPVMIGYALVVHPPFYFYLGGLITMLLTSITPIAYGIVISIIFISIPILGKNKKVISYISSGLSTLVAIGVSVYLISEILLGSDLTISFVVSVAKFVSLFNKLFPAIIANSALYMVSGKFSYILKYILINIIVAMICIIFAKLFYRRGLLNLSRNSNHTKKHLCPNAISVCKQHSPNFAIIKKDITILFRNPSYFSSCISPSFIIPFMFIVLSFTGIKDSITKYERLALEEDFIAITSAIVVILGVINGSLNYISSTTISREGADFKIMKHIPVATEEQVVAKLRVGILFSVLFYVLSLFSVNLVISLNNKMFTLSLFLGIVGSVMLNLLGVWLDLYNPTLVWLDESKAVKQNFNGMIIVVFSVILSIAITLVSINYKNKIKSAYLILSLIISITSLIIIYHLNEKTGDYLRKL